MFGIFTGMIVSFVFVWICRYFAVIPDFFDWWLFVLGIVVYARLRLLLYRISFRETMKQYLSVHADSFFEDQKILLTAASGIFLPPNMFSMPWTQLEPSSLKSWCEILNIGLLVASIFYGHYYIVAGSILVLISGYGFWLWQPSIFYTGNRQMDMVSALSFYAKAKGEDINDYSSLIMSQFFAQLFIHTEEIFSRRMAVMK